jgi:hypothetical protein
VHFLLEDRGSRFLRNVGKCVLHYVISDKTIILTFTALITSGIDTPSFNIHEEDTDEISEVHRDVTFQ